MKVFPSEWHEEACLTFLTHCPTLGDVKQPRRLWEGEYVWLLVSWGTGLVYIVFRMCVTMETNSVYHSSEFVSMWGGLCLHVHVCMCRCMCVLCVCVCVCVCVRVSV